MARFSAETVRLAKQELDESLARMQQTAQLVGQMRQRMFYQIGWMRRRNTSVLQGASGRYGGIFVSRCCTKPPGVLCGVLSMMQQTAP